MNPNANWAEQVELATAIQFARDEGHPPPDGDAERLADLVLAMEAWVKHGGVLPDAWHYINPRPSR